MSIYFPEKNKNLQEFSGI